MNNTLTEGALALHYQPSGMDTPILSVFVPGKPVSENRMRRQARAGHLYLTPEARQWESDVHLTVREHINTAHYDEPVAQPQTWAKPLRVRLTFTLARAGDVDNYVKCTLDGLKHGLGVDDRHFGTVEARLKETPTKRGTKRVTGCQIEVWPASAPVVMDDDDEDIDSALPVEHVRVQRSGPDSFAVVFPPNEYQRFPYGPVITLAQARELLTELLRQPALSRARKVS